MPYKKIADLVVKLYEKTVSDKITWEKSDIQAQFQKSFSNYSVRLSMEAEIDNRGNEYEDYYVSVFDSEGSTIERVSRNELRDELSSSGYDSNIVKEMYELARRQALGVETALDAILTELE